MKQELGRTRRRWFRTSVNGMTLVVVPVVGIVVGLIGHCRNMKPVTVQKVMTDTMTHLSTASVAPMFGRLDGLGALAAPRRAEDWMLLHPADLPLVSEPLNLPPFPAAVRETGFRRRAALFVEDFSVWQIPRAELDQVVRHYDSAAGAAGLQPSGVVPTARTRNTVYRMFVSRTDRATVLVVRVSRHGPAVRVVLWRRRSVISDQ